tara:strand:- start:140 stop:688 length:549 start_codon:yes stop_codon:yes gene_type:complete
MSTITEFYKKVSYIQENLNAPKNQFNSFGKYNYRNAEDILLALKPLAAKNGLILLVSDSIELIGERYYVKSTASLTDGQNTVQAEAFAREALSKKGMDDGQVTGSTSSYARKYALNGLLCIDDNKDADSMKSTTISEEVTADIESGGLDYINKNERYIKSIWAKLDQPVQAKIKQMRTPNND